MIKFSGNPSQVVSNKSTGSVMFVFDTKGEFFTNDENIIRAASGNFDSMEVLDSEIENIPVTVVEEVVAPVVEEVVVEPKVEEVVHTKTVRAPRSSKNLKVSGEV